MKHCLGMDITLHKKEPYEHLGLSLIYLEQFRDEVIREVVSDLEYWNSSLDIHLGDVIDRLRKRLG